MQQKASTKGTSNGRHPTTSNGRTNWYIIHKCMVIINPTCEMTNPLRTKQAIN